MRSDLPTGTVTFLFTDIESSTRLLHALGPDAYAEALAEHQRLLRKAFAVHGGVEVDTQGDAFFVAFPTASGAAAAAIAGHAVLDGGSIRVRMGLHAGTPTVTDAGYVGVDVHRAARIASLAHGGQTIVSETAAALIDAEPLIDLGRHRLKDFDAPTRLLQLGTAAFPPVRTPGAVDLPTPATAFLGREAELYDAVAVVLERDPRILTIVGPGGTGKTRFAIELARLLAEEADGATVFVPLAPLRDAALVIPAIAERLGAASTDVPGVAARVREKRTHVVLDNLEQLLPAAAPAIASLAAAAPSLRLLVTSREALRVQGEEELDLPPLVETEAVELFLARARSVRPDIDRTAVVETLCQRLDCLPLALELAAARTKLLAPEALLERLGARLDLLRGTRDADPRHATLTATIAWSYDLLDEPERSLFARFAIFRGGCTLEAAEEVCDADTDTISSLLDKSLLRRRSAEDRSDRFWMLETIRDFAIARLAESGEEDALRRRQIASLIELAEHAGLSISSEWTGRDWHLELIAPEIDNVRAALVWAADHDPLRGLELALALEAFWVVREQAEGASWFERLLPLAREAPPELRAGSLRALGGALEIYGEVHRVAPLYRESLELYEAVGDELNAANMRFRVAANMVNRRELAEVPRIIDEALVTFRRLGFRAGEAQALGMLGSKAYHEGDVVSAAQLSLQSAEIAHEVGWKWWEAHQLAQVAYIERGRDNSAEAEHHARRSLALALELGDRMVAVYMVGELAVAAACRGDKESAGRLWGAIEREERAAPIGQWPAERDDYLALLEPALGADFDRARKDGSLLTLREAAGLASAQTEP